MNAEVLRRPLTRQPFEPMRVRMSSGEVFEIRHPEIASIAKSGLVIVLPEPDGSPSDRVEYCSFLHIAGVKTIAFA
jgi:hypothetical protein